MNGAHSIFTTDENINEIRSRITIVRTIRFPRTIRESVTQPYKRDGKNEVTYGSLLTRSSRLYTHRCFQPIQPGSVIPLLRLPIALLGT